MNTISKVPSEEIEFEAKFRGDSDWSHIEPRTGCQIIEKICQGNDDKIKALFAKMATEEGHKSDRLAIRMLNFTPAQAKSSKGLRVGDSTLASGSH